MPSEFVDDDSPSERYIVSGGTKVKVEFRTRVVAQFDKTTDTVLVNIPGLRHGVEAGETYGFEACLFMDADVTGGSKYAIGGGATATAIIYQITEIENAGAAFSLTSRETALGGSAGQAGNVAGVCHITGVITVNAAGALTVQFAQNASNGTSSILVGSFFRTWRIP